MTDGLSEAYEAKQWDVFCENNDLLLENDQLKAENERLRKMVKRFYRLVTKADELWSWQSVFDELRELGIEVDG